MQEKYPGYTIKPFPKVRRSSLDAGRLGHRKHTVHGLLEIDVTLARQHVRAHKARTGEKLSFTAFVITNLAKAVGENKDVHAYQNWRNQLVIFDDVNVNTMVEVEESGHKVPMPYIVKAANTKTWWEIHQEIRAAQANPATGMGSRYLRWFLLLPWPARSLFYWVVTRNPHLMGEYRSSVLVTAVGMFGSGTAWGIPLANFPLSVTLGGIAEKPGVVDGQIEVREYLCVTLSFDHNVVDGAPAARFTQRFRELVESGHGL